MLFSDFYEVSRESSFYVNLFKGLGMPRGPSTVSQEALWLIAIGILAIMSIVGNEVRNQIEKTLS